MEEDYKELGIKKEYMKDVVIYNLNQFIQYCNGAQNFEYEHDFKQHKEVAGYIANLIKGYGKLEESHKTLSENPEWLKHYWIGRKEVDNYWKSKIIKLKHDLEEEYISLGKNKTEQSTHVMLGLNSAIDKISKLVEDELNE